MRKLPPFVAVAVLIVALSGCGGSGGSQAKHRASGPYQIRHGLIYHGHRCKPLKGGSWNCGGNLITIAVPNGSDPAAALRVEATHTAPCHGLPVASRPKRFGWWSSPGETFSRAWVCGHFGVPRATVHTPTETLWRYGPPGQRGLTFAREPDGRFSPG